MKDNEMADSLVKMAVHENSQQIDVETRLNYENSLEVN